MDSRENKKQISPIGKIKILTKALKVSFHTKSKWSLLLCISGFGMAFLPALISLVLEKFTNHIQILTKNSENIGIVLQLLILLITLYIVQLGYEFLSAYMLERDKISTTRYIKKQIMKCTCKVPYSCVENDDKFREQIAFAESYAGGRVAESIQSVVRVIQYMITFVSTAYLLWKVNGFIVIILLVTCIPAVILAAVQKDETYRQSTKWMKEGVWVIHEFFMCCGNESLNEVRHLGIFSFLKDRWKNFSGEYLDKKNALTKKHVIYNSIADILRNVVYIAVLLLVAKEIFAHPSLGVGTFILVLNTSGQLQRVTTQIFSVLLQIYTDIYFMDDFFSLEKLYEGDKEAEKITFDSYDICFSHINFRYPNQKADALKDVSVTIKDGEKIAIVGENGSGKTTFVNLLCGLYEPQKGKISIGGKNITGRLEVVRTLISVIFQDFGKYEETIRRNITVSDRSNEQKDEFLYSLLKMVGLDSFVKALPEQLDEGIGVLSEHGKNLSGGQWQKLVLARALNKQDARIMILDEPTAAMDPVAEADLYRNFAEVTGNKTTLLISHRLGVTRLADRILVFKNGEIVENGSHQELLEKNGEYAKMYRAQAQWYA